MVKLSRGDDELPLPGEMWDSILRHAIELGWEPAQQKTSAYNPLIGVCSVESLDARKLSQTVRKYADKVNRSKEPGKLDELYIGQRRLERVRAFCSKGAFTIERQGE